MELAQRTLVTWFYVVNNYALHLANLGRLYN